MKSHWQSAHLVLLLRRQTANAKVGCYMAKIMFASGSRSWANNLNDLRERWYIRREEPVKFVIPVNLFKEDLAKLSREDLLKLKVDLIKLQDDGKRELLNHQNVKREEGVALEPDKYSDLFFTIRATGAHIQEVNHALSKISQQRKEAVIAHFMDVCREKLSKEQFSEIMDEANFRFHDKSAPNKA